MVDWEAYPEDVARLVHAHPTQNDAIGEAAFALAGKPLHAHDRPARVDSGPDTEPAGRRIGHLLFGT